MPRRSNRLIFLILTLTAFTLYWGCTQPGDVVSDITSTKVTLIAERLPTLPDGMVYELWVTDGVTDVSLGKFTYDHVDRKFLDETGESVRSNEFMLAGDVFDFNTMFVSVETAVDPSPAHGPIMLRDEITDPTDDEIELRFQNADTTIGNSTVRYNMEAVSDNNRSAGDGRGVWFSSYNARTKSLTDTLHFSVTFDTATILGTLELAILYDTLGESIGVDTTNYDDIFIRQPMTVKAAYRDTTEITFGPDTLYLSDSPWLHIGYRVEFDSAVDWVAPYRHYVPRYQFVNSDTVPRTITLDLFSQDDFNLPDYGDDWKYKGWVVTDQVGLKTANPARMTPPAWRTNVSGEEVIPGNAGALFTTGTFSTVDGPDDANPFVLDGKVPLYPGEDFLDSTALLDAYGVNYVNFLPVSGTPGTVFITLEPTNFVSNTNFPLFAFIGAIPTSRGAIGGNDVQITMDNWTQTIETDLKGFPQIKAEIERF